MLLMMRQLLVCLVLLPLIGGAIPACDDEAGGDTLCTPGANIFCRCRGGEAGTKQCAEDGMSFDQCTAPTGPCPEIGGSSSSSSSGSSGDGGSSSGKELLEPCQTATECQSEICRMGYCTKDCAQWTECTDEEAEIFGDCVAINGMFQQCVPYCWDLETGENCQEKYGGPSACGYTPAVDALYVTVCADWDGVPPLPPVGHECFFDDDCHLDNLGQQLVCEFDFCVGGCHEATDCPDAMICGDGTPGACE